MAQRHVVCMSANQEIDLSTLAGKDNSCALTMERILDRDLADMPTAHVCATRLANSRFSRFPLGWTSF